jgi:FtsP/CotA-like multicopper oxidase with cupredoxin domain
MVTRRSFLKMAIGTGAIVSLQLTGKGVVFAQTPIRRGNPPITTQRGMVMKRITPAERKAAAQRARTARKTATASSALAPIPGGVADYFGIYPNYANSPLPTSVSIVGDGMGATATATVAGGVVTAITVTNGGQGYTTAPTVTIIGGGGTGATATATITAGVVTGIAVVTGGSGYTFAGIRKFVDALPGLGPTGANNLGQFISVAHPDTITYPGSDYYEIQLQEYTEKMHSDLPPTKLRGYVQTNLGTNAGVNNVAPDSIGYMGPLIIANKGRPVRIKFTNMLAAGAGGNLFIPVDTTAMGAGMGPTNLVTALLLTGGGAGYTSAPTITISGGGGTGATAVCTVRGGVVNTVRVTSPGSGYTTAPAVTFSGGGGAGAAATAVIASSAMAMYTQNRGTLHLHGGDTPWISDGTPHQWVTPATESTPYPHGVSVQNVPDMPDPGPGSMTFFYTNQQSARLMFYHDHSYGITRLNVYAGEAAGYLLQDPTEGILVNGGTLGALTVAAGTIPATQIPLVIQDRTFVPSAPEVAAEDPTWDATKYGGLGSLWFPHVYMPNQNPYDLSGANAMGRWDYGPWFWPPYTGLLYGPIPNPYYVAGGSEPPVIPGTPNPSMVPEGFMDTPIVNGTAYPYLKVAPQAYRFRILNACNDRFLNLQIYYAKSNVPAALNPDGTPALQTDSGEVPMVPAVATVGYPATWPKDGRDGGVPDPTKAGPQIIQIGTEGGFLPDVAVLPNQPIDYVYNRRDIVVLNVSSKTLFLGPAERADVIIDFSGVPTGSKLIMYNDSPAPVPAFDPRIDYYTGDPNQTDTGGAPSTLPGYGPNTRTIMQFQVDGTAAAPFNLAALQAALPLAFAASQPAPVVPQAAYNAAYPGATYPADAYVRIQDTRIGFFNGPLTALKVTAGGSGYTAQPTVAITGGGGTGAVAAALLSGVTAVAVAAGGTGYTSVPAVTFSGGGGTGAQAVAVLTNRVVTGITVTNSGSGYTTPPTVAITGGAGSGATATAAIGVGQVTGFTLTNGGTGYQWAPTVAITGGNGTGATAVAVGVDMGLGPKAIQELFTTDYGRMNATLGVELPNTNVVTQTTIPYGYIDPPTEIITNTMPGSFIGGAGDGTQIWKITHNGVDTHAIHFHLFNVQLLNRVGWDGAIRPPDKNEVGWKDTVRMNPLEDAIVALRPVLPTVPFAVPNSIRPFDVTMPLGTTVQFTGVDTNGNPVTVANAPMNYGWEYVWHCHLLGHEENDMMRPILAATPPSTAPANLVVTGAPTPLRAILTWVNSAGNANGMIVQRATDLAFTTNLVSTPLAGLATTYTDTTVAANTVYYYRVMATNLVGSTVPGYPNVTVNSAPSNVVSVGTPAAPSNVTATQALASRSPIIVSWHDNAPALPTPPSFVAEAAFTVQRGLIVNGVLTWTTLTVNAPAVAGTGGTGTYSDNGRLPNRTYYYRVLATNIFGASAPSAQSAAITAHA